MADIPTVEPKCFIAGDTVRWTKSLSDYKPEDGWTLSYILATPCLGYPLTATDNGDSTHLINIPPAISAAFTPGTYRWQSFVTDGTDRFTVSGGELEVLAELSTGGSDTRSTAQKMLAHVESLLAGKDDVLEMDLAEADSNWRVKTMSFSELMAYRSQLKGEIAQEKRAEKLAKGLGGGGKVCVRFMRAH